MPHIKNALIRYRIIDKAIRSSYKPYPSKEELRKACEEELFGSQEGEHICDSTIEKDLFAMRMEHDAPIVYSKKYRGYLYSDPEFTINDIPLTEKDLESIKFAASTLMQFKDVEMFKNFSFAIDKIFDRVTISSDPREKDIQHLVQFEAATSTKGNEYLAVLLESIRKKQIVQFEYESFQSGKKKTRRVVPLLLKEYRNRWYLISYDCVKEAIITFALERMDVLEETPEFYTRKIDFDAERFFQNAIGITVNDSEAENIVFKADNVAAKYIQSQPFHHSQKVMKEGKNKTTFSIDVIVSEELIRTFLSYGGEIEIMEPESLRESMKKRVQLMKENYSL